jgi:hypothetical protein
MIWLWVLPYVCREYGVAVAILMTGFENGYPCKKTPVECSTTSRAATECAEEYAKETSSTPSCDILADPEVPLQIVMTSNLQL